MTRDSMTKYITMTILLFGFSGFTWFAFQIHDGGLDFACYYFYLSERISWNWQTKIKNNFPNNFQSYFPATFPVLTTFLFHTNEITIIWDTFIVVNSCD
jgi:hypothetical protein